MREKPASLEQLLVAESAALDSVIAEVSLGTRNQRHFDEIDERLDAIWRGIRAAIRGGTR